MSSICSLFFYFLSVFLTHRCIGKPLKIAFPYVRGFLLPIFFFFQCLSTSLSLSLSLSKRSDLIAWCYPRVTSVAHSCTVSCTVWCVWCVHISDFPSASSSSSSSSLTSPKTPQPTFRPSRSERRWKAICNAARTSWGHTFRSFFRWQESARFIGNHFTEPITNSRWHILPPPSPTLHCEGRLDGWGYGEKIVYWALKAIALVIKVFSW